MARIIKLPGRKLILHDDRGILERDGEPSLELPREACDQFLVEWAGLLERNPLEGFEPHPCPVCKLHDNPACLEHRVPQREFLAARTRTIAAQAGNQFGKTTSIVIKALCQVLPTSLLPKHLQPYKQFEGPVQGRIVVPSHKLVVQNMLPAFRQWAPREAFKGGNIDKGWSQQNDVLTFADGSFIDFLTYETDLDKFGGVQRHFVAYDEPPPQEIRDEGLKRIMRFGGFEMFAYTPLKSNTTWLKRDIYKRREDPDITLVRGSVHDNPTLDADSRTYMLERAKSGLWRRAAEFGDFVDMGGLIYENFERSVVEKPFTREFIQSLGDWVVGIDPGIRNAAFIWIGFDRNNVAYVFAEQLLQDATVNDYCEAMARENRRWGLKRDDVTYVVDPAARQRGQVNGVTVQSELLRLGYAAQSGQNDVEAGCLQALGRMQHKRLFISPACVGLRDAADEYASEERDDGKFVPIKNGREHPCDGMRYGLMARFWDAFVEDEAPARRLGAAYDPNARVPAWNGVPDFVDEAPPMGAFS